MEWLSLSKTSNHHKKMSQHYPYSNLWIKKSYFCVKFLNKFALICAEAKIKLSWFNRAFWVYLSLMCVVFFVFFFKLLASIFLRFSVFVRMTTLNCWWCSTWRFIVFFGLMQISFLQWERKWEICLDWLIELQFFWVIDG